MTRKRQDFTILNIGSGDFRELRGEIFLSVSSPSLIISSYWPRDPVSAPAFGVLTNLLAIKAAGGFNLKYLGSHENSVPPEKSVFCICQI